LRAERDIIRFAETKLICANDLPQENSGARRVAELAVLGVRFLLEFEPPWLPSPSMEEYLVERNMRIAYSVPQHRHYLRSGYSSEPILAEAAANLMQELRTRDGHPKDTIVNVLHKHIESGLISKGELGELTARLLLILGIDRAQEATQGINPRWSKVVGVSDFLISLIGNDNYDEHIRSCVPDNSSGEAFDDYSVVRFTHFMRAKNPDGVTTRLAFAAFV